MGNSTLISVITTALAVSVGAMAAFALSRYTFSGRESLYTTLPPWLQVRLNAGYE